MKKVQLNWEEYTSLVYRLADKIREAELGIKYIGGIPRGGAVLGVMLSHILEIPYFDLIHLRDFSVSTPASRMLVVDDIVDTGTTMKTWIAGKYRTASLHLREESCIGPTFFVKTVEKGTWVVYPYEKYDKAPVQDYKQKQLLKG